MTVHGATGMVCLGSPSSDDRTCYGPAGSGEPAGAGFLAPDQPAGALVSKTEDGRTYFSVNDHDGAALEKHQGYFEFDVTVKN